MHSILSPMLKLEWVIYTHNHCLVIITDLHMILLTRKFTHSCEREQFYSWGKISTTLQVLVTIFTPEWLPHILYLPLVSVNTLRYFAQKVTSQVSKQLPMNSWKSPWISGIYSFSRRVVVVCHCLNHWTTVATIFLLSFWNCSDFIVHLWLLCLK